MKGWANQRVEQYRLGQKPTLLELYMLDHANPTHFAMVLIAMALAVWGLWTHNWLLILANCIIGFLGHVYCWFKK